MEEWRCRRLGRWARKKRKTYSWYSGFVDEDKGDCRFPAEKKTVFRPRPIEKRDEIILDWRKERRSYVIFPV